MFSLYLFMNIDPVWIGLCIVYLGFILWHQCL